MLFSRIYTSRATVQQQQQGRPRSVVPSRCSVIAHAKTPNYYDVLGVDIDASEDDIKSAYRKKAKELHPDINKSATAEDEFKQCKLAYETLADESKRREYDQVHRVRRLNFFQDIDEEELSQGWGRAVDPWEVHRKMWEKDEQSSSSGGNPDEQQQQRQDMSPEELLERLSRVMGGGGQLGQWQTGGRLDPFGSSSSEAWHRRVHEQTNDPSFNRGRSVYGRGLDDDGYGRPRQPSEWDPYRPGDDTFERRQGWQNPGRPEWQNPRRYGDDDDDEGLGGRGGSTRGPGRGGIPGDGGFRGKPL